MPSESSEKIPSETWEALIPLVVRRQQPEEEALDFQCTKNKLTKTAQITNSEKKHEKQRLTRFGLDAYVLGAMKERFY